MRNENKETNQGRKAIGESMGSRIVLALIVVAVIVTAAKVIPLVRNRVQTSQYPVIELADSSQSKADMQQEDLQRKLDWLESTDLQNRVYYQQERDAEKMEANWHDSRQSEENLEEYLHAQILLADYTELERVIMEYLICSLDSRGYFSG